MPTSNAWKSTWAALNVHWLNSIPIDREIRARTDLPVLLTLIIIYFFASPLLKRRRGVFRVSDALRDHPCWRVEGGGEDLLFSFFYYYGYTLGIRCFCWTRFFCHSVNRRYQSDVLPGLLLISYCCSGVNWKTALLPPPPLYFLLLFITSAFRETSKAFFFIIISSLYLSIYTINKAYLCFRSPAYLQTKNTLGCLQLVRIPRICQLRTACLSPLNKIS